MALDRRLDRIEQQLSPTQLVNRWLDEAHAHGSLDEYVRSTLDLAGEDQPINRLCREAFEGVRARSRAKTFDEIRLEARPALRQTVLRFELALRANVVAGELHQRTELLEPLFATQIALFGYLERDDDWRRRFGMIRDNCCRSVDEQRAVQAARVTVERRYFGDHPLLFPDLATAVDEQIASGQRLAILADVLSEHDGVNPSPSLTRTRSPSWRPAVSPTWSSLPGRRRSTSSVTTSGRSRWRSRGCDRNSRPDSMAQLCGSVRTSVDFGLRVDRSRTRNMLLGAGRLTAGSSSGQARPGCNRRTAKCGARGRRQCLDIAFVGFSSGWPRRRSPSSPPVRAPPLPHRFRPSPVHGMSRRRCRRP
jgi:hypothetical protein